MAYEFSLRRRVEFHETDMAGIVHFANFFRYMEACESAFLRSLGHSLDPRADAGRGDSAMIAWPRVHAECDYKRPLRFDDEFEVRLLVREKKEKAIAYDFVFRRRGEPAGEPFARGRVVTVSVALVGGELKAIPIPPAIGRAIEVAPPAALEQP